MMEEKEEEKEEREWRLDLRKSEKGYKAKRLPKGSGYCG